MYKCQGSTQCKARLCQHCNYMRTAPHYVFVNHELKDVYVIVPKNASTFIGQNLERQGYKLAKLADIADIIRKYYVWTFMRDPVDRFASAFAELHNPERDICFWKSHKRGSVTLAQYAEFAAKHPNFEPHMATQQYYMRPFKFDFVGCVETFDKDISIVCKRTGLTFSAAADKNARAIATPAIDDTLRARIAAIYAADLSEYSCRRH